jgi:hypothetical protein
MKSLSFFILFFLFFSNIGFSQNQLPGVLVEGLKEVAQHQHLLSLGVYGGYSTPLSSLGKSQATKSPESNNAYGITISYRLPKTRVSIGFEPGYLERNGFSGISTEKEQKVFGLGENKKVFKLYLESIVAIQAPLLIQWNNKDIGLEFGGNTSYLLGAKGKLTSQLIILNPSTNFTSTGTSTGNTNETEISKGWLDTKLFALQQWNVAYFLGAKYYIKPKMTVGFRLYTDNNGVLFLPKFGFIGKHYTEWRLAFWF